MPARPIRHLLGSMALPVRGVMKRTIRAGTLAVVLGLVATAAGAAPGVTITSPSTGSSISRAASPTIEVTGGVAFDTPQPSERTFYVRAFTNAPCVGFRLSIQRGEGEGHCAASIASFTPAAEEAATATTYAAADGVPFTLDASRPITGVVSIESWAQIASGGIGAGLMTVDVTLSSARDSGEGEVLGTTTVEYVATPLQYRYDTPWSIQPALKLDGTDFVSLQLSLRVRGRNVLHGATRANSTNLTIPIFTASFDRRVEISVDDGTFSSSALILSEDLASYTAILETPAPGEHTIGVRAAQGEASAVAEADVTVTP